VESGPAWDTSDSECPAWTACWSAICGVWASKWNHRYSHVKLLSAWSCQPCAVCCMVW
jgi:hypothetical protein